MGTTRRLALVLCIGLFVSSTGAIWVQRTDEASARPDDPTLNAAEPTTTTTAAPVTTAPPTTAAPAPAPTAVAPVRPPKNPYVPEPLVQIGTIEIPKIGLTHEIFDGISLRTIDHGPSHWPGTAMPGQVGNAVFAGHRVTHSHPFRNIDQLAPGDEVIFTIDGTRSTYVVTGSEVVTPKTLQIVNQSPTPTATLFACHPPGSAKFRFVVHLSLRS
ncbi:MAG TPA: class E sortase [Acidimicrobiales bacterium]|nr:class E sortase [Acidimicrobiales bacterium]